ncbi:MAG: DsbA family protein [Deltaproteobacteria bacterium]|nr:DsbA family protein [Deltaproteobacteria bacterium]
MRTLLAAALVIATSCGKTDELETKVAELSKELAATRRLLDELDEKVASSKQLERKIDDIERELAKTRDMLATRPSLPTRPARPEPDRSKTYAVPVDNAPSLGPANAKVTIVVAHEYACPYCEKARPTLDELRKKYGNDLRLVFKQLVVHPRNAMASALAICAADRQQKYVQMDKLLWEEGFSLRQLDLSETTTGVGGQKCWDTADGCPIVVGFAKKLGLSVTRFKSDMRECQQSLQQGMRELQTFGVAATPSFFINGRYMSGAMPIENFSALIDEELAKAEARIAQGTPKSRYYQQWVLDEGLKTLTP